MHIVARKMTTNLALLAICGLHGCASSAQTVASTAPSSIAPEPDAPASARLIPQVDHHVHLVSPASAITAVPVILPEIAIAKDIAQLLEQRAARAGNETAMAEIYADSPTILHALYPMWLRGEEALYTATAVPKNIRVVPQYYRGNGKFAVVAGIWVKGDGPAAKPITNFMLQAENIGGAWKIAAEALTAKGPPVPKIVTAEMLVSELDAGGVRRGVALSLAYQIGAEDGQPEESDEYAKVKAENDWNIDQVSRFPGRLVAVCGINPLKSYAVREVERCAKFSSVKGIKLHFGASNVDVRNPGQVEKLKRVFAAANRAKLAIIAHLLSRRSDYGRLDAEIFLSQVVRAAPDVPVQIAHMAGSGPGLDAEAAMEVYIKAAESNDPIMKNLYFDVASTVTPEASPKTLDLIARKLRQIGLKRVLFGTDRYSANNSPKVAWGAFRQLPLTDEEFRIVATNVAPYVDAPR